ncbi:hypothetical protein [Deinococcus aestuarii]|uniref:hypothetical protein n=1 Tax=Deinococcus aestuarii TaxID=2774531 RepID=UPI001C0BBB28|nr:hypothetical protein [Deinococcus aestuarii]
MTPNRFPKALLLAALLAACGHAPTTRAPDPATPTPQFGSGRRDEAYGLAPHGSGVYVVGRTWGKLYGPHQGDADAFLAKYDAAGTLVWGRQFGTSDLDDAWGVSTDTQDNAYVVGRTEVGSNTFDLFLRKYTAGGDLVWSQPVGTGGGGTGGGLAVHGSGVYVPVSIFGVASLLKYDADGTLLWTLRDHTHSDLRYADVALGPDGSVYLAGTDHDGMVLRKVTPDGGIVWTRQVLYQQFQNQTGTAVAVAQGHVYLVGNFQWWASGEQKVLVTKFGADGGQQWQEPYHNLYGTDTAWDASVDGSGNLYLAGYRGGGPHPSLVGFVSKVGPGGGPPLWTKTVAARPGAYAFAVLASPALGGLLTPGRAWPLPRAVTEVYAAGYALGDLGAGHAGDGDAFLRRLDSATGETLWTR